jgi:Flp pilus assembly protein TadG
MKHLKERLPWASQDGAGAIEFAFVAGILAVLFLGLVDFGMGFWDKMQVANGARAGAEYAVVNGWSQQNSPGDIKKAASDATYAINISNPSTTAGEVCGCPSATTGITPQWAPTGSPATCSGTCTYGTPGTYVTVSAQGDYKPIFPWPGLPSPMTFHSSAIVRIN